jgi:hypothetical protein
MSQYVVVWTIKHLRDAGSKFKDHYEVYDNLCAARTRYSELRAKTRKNKELFVCSIMAVVESTDYDPHLLLGGPL